MFELSTLRRVLHIVALVLCSAVLAATATPASARSHHSRHHAYAHSARHTYTRHFFRRHRSDANSSRWERGVAQMQDNGFDNTQASLMSSSNDMSTGMTNSGGFGGGSVVAEARQYIGGNPTSRRSLWCARFMNMVLEKTGHRGTGSDIARSFASYGHRVSGPEVGAIAVMSRHGGGHVGVVSGVDAQGNPILISGNNGNRVREASVSRGRVYAYVMPN